jgi:diacylglycerol kinase (ATP)
MQRLADRDSAFPGPRRAAGTVAVLVHTGKTLDGGLPQLRDALARYGVTDPLWYEVTKSKKARKQARRAITEGAELVFVWGGDGMVQRCIDALAGSDATLAILPAGTANLLATNLDIPKDLDAAVGLAFDGERKKLDAGIVNGEHFAVMAGAGFDALMIRDADRGLKDRVGRLAYVFTGAKNLRVQRVRARIRVDGRKWFDDKAACVLVGNVGKVLAGVTAFEEARPDDGVLELGVVTAKGVWQWTRALARTAAGRADKSPFVRIVSGRQFDVKFRHALPYELDGGDRPPTTRLRVAVHPGAVTVCVPAEAET